MSGYKIYQADSAPPALQHARWRALSETIGGAKDAVALAAKSALRCALVTAAPPDALALHRAERRVERTPGTTLEQQRARLAASCDEFEFLGTAKGLIAALDALGVGSSSIYSAYSGASAPLWWLGAWPPASEGDKPPSWTDPWPVAAGDTASWPSRFWVSLEATPWASAHWADGLKWGDDITWGSTATRADVAIVKRTIARWRPAHCVCIGVFVHCTDSPRIFWPMWPSEE